ncbi:STAS/SEC14 domain-containing protein [candidate division KSB1 bacterium]|nr:STAS/SEC14 domain-containing protein [candidate division KSB1 bacterium]NIR70451.1 STAS/SEC14 domain-containing protein [candidate division KSB1 bacterium]NIS23181.1 STAS/SEC14 domain-containing protein [candidate division KSB1 bacterium]NIT70041.1 STAS/SEC14 domain-containing protein [candidate division KSB1 bacterium]NIU23678.1 STAS/SEC14 domain-containing protein [candidate division KSB1 bacterium]
MAIELKAIEIEEQAGGKVVEVGVTGKLATEDYEMFVPEIERLIQEHGKIRILLKLIDFHGWTAGALWEDIKFDVKHFNDIERLAVVGDSKWEQGMTVFCKPFTTADIRYFDRSKLEEAQQWIRE